MKGGVAPVLAVASGLVLSACGGGSTADRGDEEADALFAKALSGGQLAITSPNFDEGAELPARFTCDATNISPALSFSGVPQGTAELAIVVDDPGAADGTFTHWIIAGLPPTTIGLAEDQVPDEAVEGRNSEGRSAYSGPCPPEGDGPHTYRFSVYALDAPTGDDVDGLDAGDALDAIADRATARATLTATYARQD